MTPHEGPSERLPDPAPGCEPPTCSPTAPAPSLSSRTHSKGQGTGGSEDGPGRYTRRPPVRPGGVDAAQPASRDRSHHLGLAPGMGVPIYSFLVARGCRRVERLEDSPSGLWRTLGKRVGCKPSGVRIPHPPPPDPGTCPGSGVFIVFTRKAFSSGGACLLLSVMKLKLLTGVRGMCFISRVAPHRP